MREQWGGFSWVYMCPDFSTRLPLPKHNQMDTHGLSPYKKDLFLFFPFVKTMQDRSRWKGSDWTDSTCHVKTRLPGCWCLLCSAVIQKPALCAPCRRPSAGEPGPAKANATNTYWESEYGAVVEKKPENEKCSGSFNTQKTKMLTKHSQPIKLYIRV